MVCLFLFLPKLNLFLLLFFVHSFSFLFVFLCAIVMCYNCYSLCSLHSLYCIFISSSIALLFHHSILTYSKPDGGIKVKHLLFLYIRFLFYFFFCVLLLCVTIAIHYVPYIHCIAFLFISSSIALLFHHSILI